MIQQDQLPKNLYAGETSSQMRSSLDVIEDTQLAIETYFDSAVPPESGECYTKVYGIMQVLYVQQDAAEHLFEVLGREFPRNEVLARGSSGQK